MAIIKVKTGGITADAITDALIADDVVGTEHLTANEVDTTALGADAVTGAQLADDAVNSEHYTDGSVDTAHIADAQITTAKLSTAVLTGATDIGAAIADADLFLMDDGAGGTIRKTAASRIKTYVGGNPITLADQWHITSNIDADNSNTDTVITNWTQDGYTGYGKIGTMSESSGVFTFPSTGMYLVELALTFYYGVAASNYSYARLQVATDGSSFSTRVETTAFTRIAENYSTTSPASAIIDVTNTSNVKVRPVYHVRSSGTDVEGGSVVRSRFRFIRLGNT